MARAAEPMFSPSCGSTRITTGPGCCTQFLVLSVPAPGMQCSSADKCPVGAAPAQAYRLRQAAAAGAYLAAINKAFTGGVRMLIGRRIPRQPDPRLAVS